AKDAQDSSTPSGNALAVTGLLRLAKLTGRRDLLTKAERTLRLFGKLLEASPMAGGQMLLALDFHLGPVQEFAVVGDPANEKTRRALQIIRGAFRPNKVVALKSAGSASTEEEMVPLLADKQAAGDVTTYVCENFTCQAPLVGVESLEAALK